MGSLGVDPIGFKVSRVRVESFRIPDVFRRNSVVDNSSNSDKISIFADLRPLVSVEDRGVFPGTQCCLINQRRKKWESKESIILWYA